MGKGLLSYPNLILRIELDQKLGELLRQAIGNAMPSEDVFEEIWQSLRDRLQNPENENQAGGFRLREFI
jgi:hypothetical protein